MCKCTQKPPLGYYDRNYTAKFELAGEVNKWVLRWNDLIDPSFVEGITKHVEV